MATTWKPSSRPRPARAKSAGRSTPAKAREQRLFDEAVAAAAAGRVALALRLFRRVAAMNGPLRARAERRIAVLSKPAPKPRRAAAAAKKAKRAAKKAGRRAARKGPKKARSRTAPKPRRPTERTQPPPRATRRRSPPVNPPPPPPPPAAPGGAEAAAPVVITRTPHLDVSPAGSVAPGQAIDVDVFADLQAARPGEESDDIRIVGDTDQRTFDIEVSLIGSSHFEAATPRTQTVTIDRTADASTHARFAVRVKEDAPSGSAVLCAYFFFRARPCGKVERTVDIAGSGATVGVGGLRRVPSARMELDLEATPADVVVTIVDPTKNLQSLQCILHTRLLPDDQQPEPSAWFLPQQSGALVAELMKGFVEPGLIASRRVLRLKGAGVKLFEAAPPAFRRLYWQLVDAGTPPASMLVQSQEPFIPWELMIPVRMTAAGREQRQPLGVECAIGRWVHEDNVAPPARVPLKDSYAIAPVYTGPPGPNPLPHAMAEAALVTRAVPGSTIAPADLDTIDETLQGGGRSLLHFSCHGADSTGFGTQVMFLEGGMNTISSVEIGQVAGIVAACRQKPLVFLNACQIGRPAVALVGIGGFAREFIVLGASGVIAPLWSVRDSIAFDVAERFYTALADAPGRAFADVLRDIRALAYQPTAGEDTYAAYCFYGDPLAVRTSL